MQMLQLRIWALSSKHTGVAVGVRDKGVQLTVSRFGAQEE